MFCDLEVAITSSPTSTIYNSSGQHSVVEKAKVWVNMMRIFINLMAAAIILNVKDAGAYMHSNGIRGSGAIDYKMSSSISSEGNRSRRTFLSKVIGISTASIFGTISPSSAWAADLPMVTLREFEDILKDSYKSVAIVELGGIKGEIVTVKLVDGTEFGISDIIDSPTDPRSPLKLVSTCKGYGIPTKFTYLDGFLDTSPKRKKVYMNNRLAEAAVKEEAKKKRMEEDEQARLKALFEMESDDI